MLMGQAKKDPSKLQEAEAVKAQVKEQADRLAELEKLEAELEEKVRKIMLVIPRHPSTPPYPSVPTTPPTWRWSASARPKPRTSPSPITRTVMESLGGIDLDAAGRVSGNGFYYLLGDIARLHEAVLAYGRDFMIDKGFTYCIPPS